MPESLKNAPESKEFQSYIRNFVATKEREHRKKVLREIASSFALMIAG